MNSHQVDINEFIKDEVEGGDRQVEQLQKRIADIRDRQKKVALYAKFRAKMWERHPERYPAKCSYPEWREEYEIFLTALTWHKEHALELEWAV